MSRRTAVVCAFALVPLALLVACSDPPSKPPPSSAGAVGQPGSTTGGGGSGEGGTTDSGADGDLEGGVCNSFALNGSTIDRIGVIGDPPTAIGGTIVDGTYQLTDYSVFVGTGGTAGPTGITAKATIVIAGGKLDEAIDVGGTGKTVTESRTTYVYSATGATIAEMATCPVGTGGKQLQFTANDPTLVLTDLTSKEAFTFTKR